MHPYALMLLLTSLAGLAMPAGALIARFEQIRPLWLQNEIRHSVIAFGGGVLLSAIALVLIPDGIKHVSTGWACLLVLAGGLFFLALDVALAKIGGAGSQLIAMLSDFIPEALALGAAFATGEPTGVLLAILIALQNLPEGFNAYREIRASSAIKPRTIILAFFAMASLGPISGLVGFHFLGDSRTVVSAIMLFAAGGILYLTFEDIAPQARIRNTFAPAFGSVLGFALGLLGHMLVVGT